ncbi:MAG: presqualene diphosphate synthase HpnD [Gammaproteobacteria bacterium]|jgi:phytoene synthase|nr:presqualene diphosphate synthase HpnD [Gammaproteobacteria bacterium]
MTPDEYCQDKAAKSGSSFYYSFLFLPPQQRQAITALYAFCREVDDVVDECDDVNVARIKLQWWREEIGRVFDGTSRHPVGQALRGPVTTYNLPQEHFLEIIDGMEMDLDHQGYASFKDLALYCHRVASIVGLMAAEIFGYQDRRTLKYAHELGMAFQLTNILRDVREDSLLGRIYLPLDELERFGVTPEDIMAHRMSDNMRELFKFQAQRAHQYYTQAYAHLPESDRYPQRSGLIMSAIYQATLKEIEDDGYNILKRRVSLTPLRKLWIAWQTARHEKSLYKKQRKRGMQKA